MERSPERVVDSRCRGVVAGLLLACLLATPVAGRPPEDDDLAIVKRGVQSARSEPPSPAKTPPLRTLPASRPLWLKVRVVEKGGRRSKVTVNLPLAVVRALGEDDFPVDLGSRRLRLSEILQVLEEGREPLVQVDDERSSVRVWVE